MVEMKIDVPCLDHNIRIVTRPGYLRTWSLVSRMEIAGLPDDSERVVLLEGGVPDCMTLRSSEIVRGTIAVEALTTITDEILTSSSQANDTTGTLAQVTCADGKTRRPLDALQGVQLGIRTKSGAIFLYRVDAATGQLTSIPLSFAAWSAARNWSPDGVEAEQDP
jgi:hypothetical protein